MGLVTCSKCKKIYDYDKYSGICPKCARYNPENSAETEHQELHDKYDGGYDHSEQEDHHRFHEQYDKGQAGHSDIFEHRVSEESTVKKRQMSKTMKIVLIVFGVVFALNFILPIIFMMLFSFAF